jgi:hypothetical protein
MVRFMSPKLRFSTDPRMIIKPKLMKALLWSELESCNFLVRGSAYYVRYRPRAIISITLWWSPWYIYSVTSQTRHNIYIYTVWMCICIYMCEQCNKHSAGNWGAIRISLPFFPFIAHTEFKIRPTWTFVVQWVCSVIHYINATCPSHHMLGN